MPKGKRTYSEREGSSEPTFRTKRQGAYEYSREWATFQPYPSAKFFTRMPKGKGIKKKFYSRSKAAAKFLASRKKKRIVHGYPGSYGPQTEFKCIDNTVSLNMDADVAAHIQLLNACAPGSAINQRVGRQTTMRSMEVRLQTYATPTTGTDQVHRVIIVYDKQANATALTAAEVLNAVDINSPRNLNNRKRFRILLDRLFTINAAGEPGTKRNIIAYQRFYLPVEYNAVGGGTIADITTGSLYIIGIGNNAIGATAGTCNGQVRIRYTDY